MKDNPDKKEEYDVLPDDLLRAIARLKGRAAPQKGVPVPVSILYPVSTAAAAEQHRKQEKIIAAINGAGDSSAFIGYEIPGRGIYLGKYKPQDRKGRSLGKTFNIYAAPEDLTDDSGNHTQRTYVDTVKHLSTLKNWHNHDGAAYKNDTAFYAALEKGSYKGKWVIPPCELQSGNDVRDEETQPDNLYDHMDKNALSGTFNTAASDENSHVAPDWYWSSTDDTFGLRVTCFSDGAESWDTKNADRLSCRPVRLELMP